MAEKQNPFSIYDFLGYLIPGATTVYLVLIFHFLFGTENPTITDVLDTIKIESQSYIPFIICSYLLGHILSFLSSQSVEKYSLWRYGYPSSFLFGKKHAGGFWSEKRTCHQIVWRIVISGVLLPMVIFDLIMGSFLKLRHIYTRALDTPLCNSISQKEMELFEKLKISDHYRNLDQNSGMPVDAYRIILHYAYEHSKSHQNKLNNYVALYGFLRTMCLIFNLLSWVLLIYLLSSKFSLWIWIHEFLTLCFSYILFMGFMKFYRRYTLEGYMVLISLE